ncbi:hypothetical protein Tco_1525502 [Tanacetum coccineum]
MSLDHPLTHASPTPIATRASFPHRTVRMTVRAQPAMSPGLSARVIKAMTLSDSAFCKRYRSSHETPSPSPTLLVWKRYKGTSELILDIDSKGDELGDEDTEEDEEDKSLDTDDERERSKDEGPGLEGRAEEAVREGQQQAVQVVDTTVDEPLGLGYGAARRPALESTEEIAPSMYEVGHSSRSVHEHERAERVSAFRQPILTTWVDPEDGRVYTNIPAYVPPVAPVQTPPYHEWSSGSLPFSPSSSVVPSPIAS